MKKKYPLMAKQEIQQRAKNPLDPRGYFCLDKASFFIDDPTIAWFLMG